MGRTPRKRSAPPSYNALVASASSFRGTKEGVFTRKSTSDTWQTEAWGFYHSCGEFRFGCDWVGSMLSKALLYGTVLGENGVERADDETVTEIVAGLFGNEDGRAELLRLAGIHMSVAGEFYIATYPNPDKFGDGGDVWEIAASTKAKKSNLGIWTINDKILDRDLGVNPEEVHVIRIWRPDPIEPEQATSPARAVLRTLRELSGLSDHVAAQIDSRLAGAGILLLPSGIDFPTPPTEEGAEQVSVSTADSLTKVLTDAMSRAITNRASAQALVPIVITAPAEAISAVQHLTFWSELQAQAIELRNEAIRRLALGMDMPPEVLQGAADSNHWSAWQADESAIKSHTEPLLKIITSGLARAYLRPLLSDEGGVPDEDLRLYSIAADTSEMRLRPNRSKEALELHERMELSGKALLRETGFDESDAPTEEELRTMMLRKIAGGSTGPEQVNAALKELGIDLGIEIPGEGDQTEAPPAPSLEDHPTREIPDPQVSKSRKDARDEGRVPSADVERKASLIAASEQVVLRALERAGNKLKTKMSVRPTCAAADIYKFVSTAEDTEFLLNDAWVNVPAIASRAGLNDGVLTSILADYTSGLLETQHPHSFDRLSAFVTRALEDLEAAA